MDFFENLFKGDLYSCHKRIFYQRHYIAGTSQERVCGAVYYRRKAFVDQEVAVKVILPNVANQPDFIRPFETEAQLVAQTRAPAHRAAIRLLLQPRGRLLSDAPA